MTAQRSRRLIPVPDVNALLTETFGEKTFTLAEIDIMIERQQDAINMRLEILKALYNMRAILVGLQRESE